MSNMLCFYCHEQLTKKSGDRFYTCYNEECPVSLVDDDNTPVIKSEIDPDNMRLG